MSPITINRRRNLLVTVLALCAGAFSIAACDNDSNPPDEGTVALAITPTTINVAQGGSGSSAASIVRGGGFTGPVTLSASGAPSGVTVTFTPAIIPAGSTTAGISVAVGAAVPPGDKAITISAEGDGVTTATTPLTVAVVSSAAGSFVLLPVPASLTAAVGGAAVTSAVGITRTAPFAGAVGLSVTGQPAGVTATITPASATGSSATLSVTAAAGAVNGTYPLVVRGTGAGVSDATATVPVTVTGGAAGGASFTFSPTPLPVTAGGASNASTVTITRTGSFSPSGALNLALTGAPAGLTATVAPSTNVTAGTATVTAQATGAVAAGTYNLTLTGTGTGIPNAVGTLPVTVTGGGGGGNVSLTFCAQNAPVWAAIQSGSGAWTRVTPTAGTTYQFTFTSNTGGVALVQPDGAGTELNVFYGTFAELNAAAPGVAINGCGGKTVNGTAVGVGVTESAAIHLGSSTASATSAVPAFVLQNVPEGSLDLIATRTTLGSFSPNSIILRRGLNQLNNSTITPNLDFNTGFAPTAAYTVALSNLGADQAIISNSFLGLNGSTTGDVGTILGYTGTAPVAFNAVPFAQLIAGELQSLIAVAADASNSNAARIAGTYYHTPANKTIAMGPDLSTPTVSNVVAAPNAWPLAQLPGQVEYNRIFVALYSQNSLNRAATVRASAAYYGAAPTTWNVALPNLSTVTGWSSAWGLASGTGIDWTVSAQGGTDAFLAPPADGSTFMYAGVASGSPLNVRRLHTASR